MSKELYIIVEKQNSEFAKVLNQWKHVFDFEIVWMCFDNKAHIYRALIKRWKKE